MSFDIIRRVLADYFQYDIQYVMNVTDVDDKIIKKARQTHLFKLYTQADHPVDKLVKDCKEAIQVSFIIMVVNDCLSFEKGSEKPSMMSFVNVRM